MPRKMEALLMEGMRPRGRRRRRWIDGVKMDEKKRGLRWQMLEEEELLWRRIRWRDLVNTQIRE